MSSTPPDRSAGHSSATPTASTCKRSPRSSRLSRRLREESLELLAYRDPLTGLLNRRALDEQAAQAFDVPTGTSRSVTVVAVDINRLKHVNDTLGTVPATS